MSKLTKTDAEIIVTEGDPKVAEELPDTGPTLEIGQWYWVKGRDDKEWFGCITHLGSNYAEMTSAGGSYTRIHFDEFDKECRFEPEPSAYIDGRIQHYQDKVHRLMGRVKEITARLGVTPSPELRSGNETAALAKINAGQDFNSYSKDLVKAKEDLLPDLFQKISKANESLATWMTAKVVPLKAQAKGMRDVIGKIEDRIFSVELYAGLTETVEKIADGDPAPLDTKIHLLQRRHYMDEECLARYQTGGMEFKDIHAFDDWLCKPDNLKRILPFPRCIVAFRVRRNEKHREFANLRELLRILEDSQYDKVTFLYIRNGDQVFRLNTKLDFGVKLFPDMDRVTLNSNKLWAKMFGGSVEKIISDNEYQGMREEHAQRLKEWRVTHKAYEAALTTPEAKERAKKKGIKEPDASCVDVPWPGMKPYSDFDRYEPYTPESVYYDDISGKIQGDIKHHNRIGLVLQGLLDRSPVLHPHPPWQIWTNEGFESALELVYDESRALTPGDKPDFEAYRQRLNKKLKTGSITVGQEDSWERYEAAKECRRRDNDWRDRSEYRPDRWRPQGNPGPGTLARVTSFSKRTKRCSYAWNRERQTQPYGEPIRTTYTCPANAVLNVDAYKPGDFRIFFDDPRTRADYLKWAPLLLEAEEYHAGNRKIAKPPPRAPKKESSWEGQRRYAMRKRRKELMGKAVRLVEEIATRGGTTYAVGTLWRVTGGEGQRFTIVGINEDGSREEGERWVRGVHYSDLKIDPSIPSEPEDEDE